MKTLNIKPTLNKLNKQINKSYIIRRLISLDLDLIQTNRK